MKTLAMTLCLLLATSVVFGATYQWTDKTGAVHFTDDPDRIPAEYVNKAQQLDLGAPPMMKYEEEAPPQTPTATPGEPAATTEQSYCGIPASKWQKRYQTIRAERENLAAALPEMESQVKKMRLKVLSRTGRDGSYYQQKKEYIEQSEQYEKAKARKEDAERRFTDLENEAARCGVPLELRQ